MCDELNSLQHRVFGLGTSGLQISSGVKGHFGQMDILFALLEILRQKQFGNTFKIKVSLTIHPTDATSCRSVGFLDIFDKTNDD